MPLCHWPCSCYPNHALGQTHDWMNEIYPRWVAAHGVMIVTPVNWYHVPSVLKLMIDRLVCADGGNPDPTTTHGKDAAQAKALELDGLGVSEAPRGPRVRRRRARRRRGPARRATRALRLARMMGLIQRRPERRARPLHRLLRAVRDEPRRARPRRSRAGRGAQRRPQLGRALCGRFAAASTEGRTSTSSRRARNRGRPPIGLTCAARRGAMLRVCRHADARDFLTRAESWLAGSEIEHAVALASARNARANNSHYERPSTGRRRGRVADRRLRVSNPAQALGSASRRYRPPAIPVLVAESRPLSDLVRRRRRPSLLRRPPAPRPKVMAARGRSKRANGC